MPLSDPGKTCPDLWCRVNDSFVILPRGKALVKQFGEYIVPNLTCTHYIW
jgi:hypothetical protein